jgi:hypothetical protein
MEPAKLTPSPCPPDAVETWLRAHAAPAPLADDGFSARVLAALPPPWTTFSWRRPLLCTAGALSGLAVAWARGGGWPDPAMIARQWNELAVHVVQFLGDPWWSLTLAGASVAAAVMFAIRTLQQESPSGPKF